MEVISVKVGKPVLDAICLCLIGSVQRVTELLLSVPQGRPPPSRGRPSDTGRGRQTPRPSAAAAGRVHLPPVTAAASARQSASFPPAHGDLSESFSRLSRSRRGAAAARESREAEVAPPAARGASAASEQDRAVLTSRGALTSRGQLTSGRRRKLSLSESTELFRQVSN